MHYFDTAKRGLIDTIMCPTEAAGSNIFGGFLQLATRKKALEVGQKALATRDRTYNFDVYVKKRGWVLNIKEKSIKNEKGCV